MQRTYFEDVSVGDSTDLGSYRLDGEEMVAFAERYDPQPMHTEPERAEDSVFGGLIASGWYTASATMRVLVEGELADSAAIGAIGVDELRWRNPVRPDAVLSARTEVLETEPWDDAAGLVHSSVRATNEADEEVLSMVGLVLYERRDSDDADAG